MKIRMKLIRILPEKRKGFQKGHGGGGGSPAALTKFDQMLENAEITPDLFERLGHGLKDTEYNYCKACRYFRCINGNQ
jgi:hypothetical protein